MKHEDFCREACSQARMSAGISNPNPSVGAVIVKKGRIIGKGRTSAVGGAHAEINALNQAGDAAAGAELYVTMTPCSHHGRTPPCTDSIINSKIAKIHIAVSDNSKKNLGRSLQILKKAGINTVFDFPDEQKLSLIDLNEGFHFASAFARPLVTAKYAMTLDGKIAAFTGDSKWISGKDSRRRVHHLRILSDAVMVGENTAYSDDPELTARMGHEQRQPLRVVFMRNLKDCGRLQIAKKGQQTLLITSAGAQKSKKIRFPENVRLLTMPLKYSRFEMKKVLNKLTKSYSINSVLAEGGSGLFGSLFDSNLIDRIYVYISSSILGGGLSPITAAKPAGIIRKAPAILHPRVDIYNRDICVSGIINPKLFKLRTELLNLTD